jgi:hypothetical protein
MDGFYVFTPSDEDVAQSRLNRIGELRDWKECEGLTATEEDELRQLEYEDLLASTGHAEYDITEKSD